MWSLHLSSSVWNQDPLFQTWLWIWSGKAMQDRGLARRSSNDSRGRTQRTISTNTTSLLRKKTCSEMLMLANFPLYPGSVTCPWSENTSARSRLSELWPFRTSRSEVSHNLPITIPVITRLTFHWLWLQMSSHNLWGWVLPGHGSAASHRHIFLFAPALSLYFNIFLRIWFHKHAGCVYDIKFCLKWNWKLSTRFKRVIFHFPL